MPRPAHRRPNLRDVAARADVSIATVSRVVNGQPIVLPETRRRVEDAINVLGYVPNSHARRLAQTGHLADSEPITWIDGAVKDAIGEQMLTGALRAAALAGQSVTVVPHSCDVDEPAVAAALPANGAGARCECAVVRGTPEAAGHLSLRLGGRQRCRLTADHRLAGALAGGRLGLGRHVDALFITGECADVVVDGRRSGLASALAAVGGNLEVVRVRREVGSPALAQAVVMQAMHRIPRRTAVVVDSVANAIGVYRALEDVKFGIPEDVSVIAFDDENTRLARHLDPPLTTVDTRYDHVGELAIAMLGDMTAGEREHVTVDELLVAPRLVEGGSVGLVASRTTPGAVAR